MGDCEPSVYYLWLREHPEEVIEPLLPFLAAAEYRCPSEAYEASDGDLTLSA